MTRRTLVPFLDDRFLLILMLERRILVGDDSLSGKISSVS